MWSTDSPPPGGDGQKLGGGGGEGGVPSGPAGGPPVAVATALGPLGSSDSSPRPRAFLFSGTVFSTSLTTFSAVVVICPRSSKSRRFARGVPHLGTAASGGRAKRKLGYFFFGLNIDVYLSII